MGDGRRILGIVVLTFNFFLSTSLASAGMAVQACFSPVGKCSGYIVREIDRAQREVLVAVFAFTSDDLAWALAKARKRGIKVQVILDREFDKGRENSKGLFLEQQGVSVRRVFGAGGKNSDKEPGLMHQKFAVIDRKVLLTGSYNWTVAADKFNNENLLLFHDAAPLADEYRKEFFRLWEKRE
jgi:phosphatidylserine/phosphatidylglycerophosphate/cardiolipin synthase-like enzyme